MNKLINKPEDMISEMLDGYLAVYPGLYEKIPDNSGRYLGLTVKERKDKVSVVTGGGSGNEPWIIGYVGPGLADGAALGQVYTAPAANAVLAVSRCVPNAKGIVYVATNHAGDVLNFELVRELAGMEGIEAKCVFVCDDVTTAPKEKRDERRGVAGVALAVKIAGAASESGAPLDDVYRITEKAVRNLSTCSLTTSPGYMPSTGKAMCDLPDGEVAYGMGFNGESPVLQTPLPTADEAARTLMSYLTGEIEAGDEVAVMVNGFGFTSRLELCIAGRAIKRLLDEHGVRIYDMFIDELFCPQGTGGFSVSILKLDDELKALYAMPACSPFYKAFARSR